MSVCFCDSGALIDACCLPLISGAKNPLTAKALMRSRYTAYTQKNDAYLLKTWHPSTRPERLNLAQDATVWQGLKIIECHKGLEHDNKGSVEFIATYRMQDKIKTLHETSLFIKEAGSWFYLKGDIKPDTKLGRNDPCHCGSLKKFKKCCGA